MDREIRLPPLRRFKFFFTWFFYFNFSFHLLGSGPHESENALTAAALC
jgi:hypothetical protein